jgi:hypothetical protein
MGAIVSSFFNTSLLKSSLPINVVKQENDVEDIMELINSDYQAYRQTNGTAAAEQIYQDRNDSKYNTSEVGTQMAWIKFVSHAETPGNSTDGLLKVTVYSKKSNGQKITTILSAY